MTRRSPGNAEAADSLAAAVERLCSEITVVRQVLDAILDELQWANQNRRDEDPSVPTPPLLRLRAWRVTPPRRTGPNGSIGSRRRGRLRTRSGRRHGS